jgi:hypothetical protein
MLSILQVLVVIDQIKCYLSHVPNTPGEMLTLQAINQQCGFKKNKC